MKATPFFITISLFFVLITSVSGQTTPSEYDTTLIYNDGRIMRVRITGDDTIFVATFPEVIVKAPRVFANDEEYRQYMRYRRYATQVLPYAIESIKLYRKYERETEGMRRGEARKYAKQLQKEVKEDFTDPLKDLTRTQGKILVKMIERHLDTPMYDVLKNVRGGFTATKWQTVGKLYGYDLKDGYSPGEDKVLDMILGDFEISID
ncbi:MAG: DUF4294 domain-containing protein [Saprospiraceae bacterium]